MRVSYNDYLSILESVSKQLNRAIKSEVSLNSDDDIHDHDFDGKRDIVYFHYFFCSEKRKTNQTQQPFFRFPSELELPGSYYAFIGITSGSLCGGESRCVESYVNGIDHKFVNLDLDPLDFKSTKAFLKKAFTALKKWI